MSNTQYTAIARGFVEEIFNARKTEVAENFVTPDIVYHGMSEEVRGIDEFKKWVSEELRPLTIKVVTLTSKMQKTKMPNLK